MKKMGILMTLTVMLLSGCVKEGPQGKACPEDQSTNAATAKDYAQTLIDHDYDTALTYNYSAEMSEVLNNGKMIDLLKSKIDSFGEFKEVQAALCSSEEGKHIITLPMKFSKQNFNLNISFDSEGKITGITFSEFTGK